MTSIAHADHFNINVVQASKNVSTGGFDFYDPVTLSSNVNETITIQTNVTGVPSLIFLPKEITLTPNSSVDVSPSVVVPIDTVPDKYDFTFNFTYNNHSVTSPITLDVYDSVPPTVIGCSYNKLSINRTTQIDLICSSIEDNVNVTSAFLYIENNTFDINLETKGVSFVMDELGTFNSSVFVYDAHGNEVEVEMPQIEVTSFNPIISFNVDFLHIQNDRDHRRPFATIIQDANVSLRIDRFGFTKEVNNTMVWQVILPDGSIRNVQEFGKPVELGPQPPGDVLIQVSSKNLGEFAGAVSLISADKEYASNINGIFDQYTVMPNTTFSWFGNVVWCQGIDAGAFENSTNQCVYTFPVQTSLNESSLPVNFQIYNDLNLGNYDLTLLELQHFREEANFWKIVFFILLGIFVAFAVYILWWDQRDE